MNFKGIGRQGSGDNPAVDMFNTGGLLGYLLENLHKVGRKGSGDNPTNSLQGPSYSDFPKY